MKAPNRPRDREKTLLFKVFCLSGIHGRGQCDPARVPKFQLAFSRLLDLRLGAGVGQLLEDRLGVGLGDALP
jgi:hypothetical protein